MARVRHPPMVPEVELLFNIKNALHVVMLAWIRPSNENHYAIQLLDTRFGRLFHTSANDTRLLQ